MHVEMICDENKKALQKAITQRIILIIVLLIISVVINFISFDYFTDQNVNEVNTPASLRVLSIMCATLFLFMFMPSNILKLRKDRKYLKDRNAYQMILINKDGIENEFYKDNILEREALTWDELIRMEEINYIVEYIIGKNYMIRHIRVSDGKMHEWLSQIPRDIPVPKQLKYMKKLAKSLPDGGRSRGITLEYSDDVMAEIKEYWKADKKLMEKKICQKTKQ